jgi:transcription initiation factor TFIIB
MDRPGWLTCSNANCRAEKGFRDDGRTGDIVCSLCGRVAQEKVIDMGSEWRNFGDSGENKSRAEGVDDINDKLSTTIQSTKSQEKNNAAMSKLQQQISGNEQKALSQAANKISEFGEGMNLPNTVLKSAKKIYKDFETKKKRKIRGSNSDAFIVAVLYIACKENGLSRTFKELARETGIKELEVRRMYQQLTKHLGPMGSSRSTPVAPHDLVIRICSHLRLQPAVMYLAQQIAKNGASRLEGKSPSSIAAASILMAVKHENVSECTEREIATAASISPSTVKNIYKEMEGIKDELITRVESQSP